MDGILAGLIKLRKISVHQRLFKSAATLVPTIWSSDGPQRTFMGTGHSPYATNYAPRHATNPPHRTLIVPPSRTNLKRHDVNLNNKGCGRPRDLLNELFQKTKKKKKTPTPYRSIEREMKNMSTIREEKKFEWELFFCKFKSHRL